MYSQTTLASETIRTIFAAFDSSRRGAVDFRDFCRGLALYGITFNLLDSISSSISREILLKLLFFTLFACRLRCTHGTRNEMLCFLYDMFAGTSYSTGLAGQLDAVIADQTSPVSVYSNNYHSCLLRWLSSMIFECKSIFYMTMKNTFSKNDII